MKSNTYFKDTALAALRGNWGQGVLATLVYFIIVSIIAGPGFYMYLNLAEVPTTNPDEVMAFMGTYSKVFSFTFLLEIFLLFPLVVSYLNSFPANILKIDKSFIDKMNTSDPSKQYVAAIISIGHIMGFEVVSEGVEEKEQLATLKLIGCDYIQGFIWGRPLSQEDAEKLIRESIE